MHCASVADDDGFESVETSSFTLFTVTFVLMVVATDVVEIVVVVMVFWFCCSISVAGESEELDEDDEDDVADFCWPWSLSYICLSSRRIRSSSVIRGMDSSSSVVVVESVMSMDVSCLVVLIDEGLFSPSDECFKCAFGLSTTSTFDAFVEVLMCSKAN